MMERITTQILENEGKEMVWQCQLQLVALFAKVLKAKMTFGSST
jgi:hypothetical protein